MLKKVETKEDLETLALMANEIWHEYFPCILTGEQIDYMVEKFQSYKAISKQIEKGYQYYFIMADSVLMGYIGIFEDNNKMFLSKLYLKKEYRGKGYAGKVIDSLVKMCLEHSLSAIWLTVNKHNHHSIAVYERKDFTKIKAQISDIGNGFVMDDYVMERKI